MGSSKLSKTNSLKLEKRDISKSKNYDEVQVTPANFFPLNFCCAAQGQDVVTSCICLLPITFYKIFLKFCNIFVIHLIHICSIFVQIFVSSSSHFPKYLECTAEASGRIREFLHSLSEV